MITETISIQSNVPLDGFTQLKELLSSIKESLKELVAPLKEIGKYIQSIGKLSSDASLSPEVDTTGLEKASSITCWVSRCRSYSSKRIGCYP